MICLLIAALALGAPATAAEPEPAATPPDSPAGGHSMLSTSERLSPSTIRFARRLILRNERRLARELRAGRTGQAIVSLRVLGGLHDKLGEVAIAEDRYRTALQMARELSPAPTRDLAGSLASLASFLTVHGRPAEGIAARQEEVEVLAALYGDESLEWAVGSAALAAELVRAGEVESGVASAEIAIAVLDRSAKPDASMAGDILFAVGHAYLNAGRFDAARETFARLSGVAAGSQDAGQAAEALVSMGTALFQAGDFREAQATFAEALAAERSASGEKSTEVADALEMLAATAVQLDDHPAAATYYAGALDIRVAILGEVHRTTVETRWSLASALMQSEAPAEAIAALAPGLAITEKLGTDRPLLAQLLRTRSICLERLGRTAEALADADRVLELIQSQPGPDAEDVAYSLDHVARLREEVGDFPGAVLARANAWEAWAALRGPGSREAAAARARLGHAKLLLEDYAGALEALLAALWEQERLFGPHGDALAGTLLEISDALVRTGRLDEGTQARRRAVAILATQHGEAAPEVLAASTELVLAPLRAGRTEEALAAARRLSDTTREGGPDAKARALTLLGRAMCAAGRVDEARITLDGAVALAEEGDTGSLALALIESAVAARRANDADAVARHRAHALSATDAIRPRDYAHVALMQRMSDAFIAGDTEAATWASEALVLVARNAGDPAAIAQQTDSLILALTIFGANQMTAATPNTRRAIAALLRARQIDNQEGERHAATISYYLGHAYLTAGDPEVGSREYQDSIRRIQQLGADHEPRLLPLLLGLRTCQMNLDDALGAIETTRQMLSISERAHGSDSAEVLSELDFLALQLEDVGQNAEAAAVYRSVLTVHDRLYPDDRPGRLRVLRQLGRAAGQAADWPAAILAYEAGLGFVEAETGMAVGEKLGLRDDLTFARAMAGDDEGAVREEAAALRIAEEAFGRMDSRPVQRVVALASNMVLRRAEPTQALVLVDSYLYGFGDAEDTTGLRVSLLLARSSALGAQGRIAESLESLDQASELTSMGLASPQLQAEALLARARWEHGMGSPSEAVRLVADARDVLRGADFDEELWEIRTLPMLIEAYLALGDLDGARAALERLSANFEAFATKSGAPDRGIEQGQYLVARLSARHLDQLGDIGGALEKWNLADKLCHRVLPPGSRACLEDGQGLAATLARSGDMAAALDAMARTSAVADRYLRFDDPMAAAFRMDLAWYSWAAGDVERARGLIQDAVAVRSLLTRELMIAASDEDRLRAAAYFRPMTDIYLSFFDTTQDASASYSLLVSAKGLTAAATLRLEGLWRDSPEPGVDVIAQRLSEQRGLLTSALIAGPADDSRLSAEVRRLERRLARIGARRAPVVLSAPDLATVCHAVPTGGVFIDYVRYERRRPNLVEPTPAYAAFVVQQESCLVQRFELGPAADIDAAANDFRVALAAGRAGASAVLAHGDRLRRLVWDPLAAAVEGKRVVIAPDGTLGVIPFAALPTSSGRFLVEERHIQIVESAFDLLRATPPTHSKRESALVVGGIEYGPVGRHSTVTRGCGPGSTFADLPATDREAAEVAGLLEQAGVTRIVALRGGEATEFAVRTALADAAYIHLATHGFFSDCASREGHEDSPGGFRISSGLALAGANSARVDIARPDDGILLAEEVAQMDLRGVRVAVLSACETGLGALQDGEGVIGLRRAFSTAGVDTLVVSLWNVEDEPTRVLMASFYGFMAGGRTPSASLRDAQLALLAHNRAAFGEVRAHTWAAFEAIGGR